MRRGRLPATTQPATTQPATQAPRPSKSPAKVTNGDPFAALDSKVPIHNADELSSRFPTLDQFSILHDHGTKFEFDSGSSQPVQQSKDLSQRVVERLADEAFQTKPSPSPAPQLTNQRQSVELRKTSPYLGASSDTQRVSPPLKSSSAPPKQAEMSRASAIISSTPELKAISSQASQPVYQPTPNRPVMVSTGTMTTPPPDREIQGQYQVYRFPPADHRNRASSLPRQQETGQEDAGLSSRPSTTAPRPPSFQSQPLPTHIRHPSSSRPSLESGRPNLDALESTSKPKPTSGSSSRPRPVSTHLESNLDYLRAKESGSKPLISPRLPSGSGGFDKDLPPPPSGADNDGMNIESNVDFLRSMEDNSDPKKKDKIHKHNKRSSLTSLGAGTKNILAGKFGDAFKRFEGGNNSGGQRTPSPLRDLDLERRNLTPIAGSEATDGRSDDGRGSGLGEGSEEMTPEMRREQEARMLAAEEARVAAAQAEYRSRIAAGSSGSGPTPLPKSIGGVSRAVSIQNKVQSLLDESNRSRENVVRTAQGYGHFSDAQNTGGGGKASGANPGEGRTPPVIARKPTNPNLGVAGQQQQQRTGNLVEPSATGRTTASGARPMAPPKPTHLNSIATGGAGAGGNVLSGSPPKPSKLMAMSSGITSQRLRPNTTAGNTNPTTGTAQQISGGQKGLMSATVNLGSGQGQREAMLQMTAAEKDDYIRDFQKRFPSLGAIEMVERDIGAEGGRGSGR